MSTFTYPEFTAKQAITANDGYKCPSCGNRLNPENAGKTYRCLNNHSFDRAKEGYLNLLLAQHKRSRNPGDSDEMIRSRQRFLNRGYYDNLALHISQQLSSMAINSRVLDIGCGEGFYLQAISAVRDDLQLVGVDISKTAVRLAAKRPFNAQLAVDSSFNLALFDNSIDMAMAIFSPFSSAEASRVIKPKGYLMLVGPGKQHLSGLTAHIYDQPVPHQGNHKFIDNSDEFRLLNEMDILQTIDVEGSAIADLLHMTPYYWHAKPAQQQYLRTLERLTTDIHFNIRLYQNCVDSLP